MKSQTILEGAILDCVASIETIAENLATLAKVKHWMSGKAQIQIRLPDIMHFVTLGQIAILGADLFSCWASEEEIHI